MAQRCNPKRTHVGRAPGGAKGPFVGFGPIGEGSGTSTPRHLLDGAAARQAAPVARQRSGVQAEDPPDVLRLPGAKLLQDRREIEAHIQAHIRLDGVTTIPKLDERFAQ